jgi:hypothetical protein
MTNQYLHKEYELCFEQLRFYDERHNTTLKFLFSLTSAVATAEFAIYKFLQGPTQGFFASQAFLSSVVFVATLLLYLSMLRNRIYFVYTARQLNAIRAYLMKTEAEEFNNNQLFTSTDFPALKILSVHTIQLLGVVIISSLFAGALAYAIGPTFYREPSLLATILTFVLVAAAEMAGGIKYLSSISGKSADDMVHGKNPAAQK